MSVWSDNANAFAERDRAKRADQVMRQACHEAAGILRLGRAHGDAEWARYDARIVLERAGHSATRLLGRRTPSHRPGAAS